MGDLALEDSRSKGEQVEFDLLASRVYDTFKAMDLNPKILEDIQEYGYNEPSEVQKRIIVPLSKWNVFGLIADSEPGKTSAISLGILQKLDYNDSQGCQALVLTDTSMLSVEFGKDLQKLGASLGVIVYVLGEPRSCPLGVHVVVGPITSMMYWLEENGGSSWTKNIKVVVLNEADRISEKMINDMTRHLLPWPAEYQVGVFSETMSKKVEKILDDWKLYPVVKITVPSSPGLKGKGKHQVFIVGNAETKPDSLVELYKSIDNEISVVLVAESKTVALLVKKMEGSKFKVLYTDKNMNQKARDKIVQELLQAGAPPRLLITTEEWANGIDLKHVTLVVNYDLPKYQPGKYLPRLGRFGEVDVINLVSGNDWWGLFDIQEYYNNSDVVFELYPVQASQEGYAVLKNNQLSEASKDIKHLLFDVLDEKSKLKMVCDNFSEDLAKTKSVIFVNARETEYCAKLKSKGFNTFTMGDLGSFLQCEGHCILITTDDGISTVDFNVLPKIPVVINFDLPLKSEFYHLRNAWCGKKGVALHFVTANDWFMVFHLQSPESVIGWSSQTDVEFSRCLQEATKANMGQCSQGATTKWSGLEESGLEQETTNLAQSFQQPTLKKPKFVV